MFCHHLRQSAARVKWWVVGSTTKNNCEQKLTINRRVPARKLARLTSFTMFIRTQSSHGSNSSCCECIPRWVSCLIVRQKKKTKPSDGRMEELNFFFFSMAEVVVAGSDICTAPLTKLRPTIYVPRGSTGHTVNFGSSALGCEAAARQPARHAPLG